MTTETPAPTVYEIAPYAVPDWLARIEKLSKKSMKLLGKPIAPVFHGLKEHRYQVRGRWTDAEGSPYIRLLHRYSVEAETPQIKGWTFVATLDHSMAGGNMLRSLPGAAPLPERFRTVEANCEHCNVKRNRHDTFVLLSDAGVYKQIGRQCVRDFIGYDVAAIAQSAVWLAECLPSDSDGDNGYGGGGRSHNIPLATYLAHVNAAIRKFGWRSAKDVEIRGGESTRSIALTNMFPPRGWRGEVLPLTEADYSAGTEALAWAKTLQGRNDYEYNIRLIAEQAAIESRSCGFAASIIPAHARAMEFAIKRAEKKQSLKGSQHIGVEKQRLKDIEATLYGHTIITGNYGTTHIYRFVDSAVNVLVWFASAAQNIDLQDRVILTGTVKKLDEYEGIKQTVLTRCVVSVKPDEEVEQMTV